MVFNVYRTSPDLGKELCLKKQYASDIVEYLTGEILGDTLPAILSEKAGGIYNGMRLMKFGETFEYEDYLIECIYK